VANTFAGLAAAAAIAYVLVKLMIGPSFVARSVVDAVALPPSLIGTRGAGGSSDGDRRYLLGTHRCIVGRGLSQAMIGALCDNAC
jgi:hypothetical protein